MLRPKVKNNFFFLRPLNKFLFIIKNQVPKKGGCTCCQFRRINLFLAKLTVKSAEMFGSGFISNTSASNSQNLISLSFQFPPFFRHFRDDQNCDSTVPSRGNGGRKQVVIVGTIGFIFLYFFVNQISFFNSPGSQKTVPVGSKWFLVVYLVQIWVNRSIFCDEQ